jgi:hypothetical protein
MRTSISPRPSILSERVESVGMMPCVQRIRYPAAVRIVVGISERLVGRCGCTQLPDQTGNRLATPNPGDRSERRVLHVLRRRLPPSLGALDDGLPLRARNRILPARRVSSGCLLECEDARRSLGTGRLSDIETPQGHACPYPQSGSVKGRLRDLHRGPARPACRFRALGTSQELYSPPRRGDLA